MDTSNEFSGDNRGQMFQAGRVDHVAFHSATPSPTLKALAGLPPTTPIFRGRASELEVLRSAWEAGGGPSIVASGLAGIGKTELVLHAAHRAVAEGLFPGGVLFVDLQGYDDKRRVTPAKALETFLLALGVPGSGIPSELDQRAALFRSLLTEQPTMLIFLDNAQSAEQVRDLQPGTMQHRVVITSRHTLASLAGAQHIDVGLLSEDEAVELVGSRELALLCGRLPLALRIVKALLTTDPHADWAGELREARTRLDLLDDGDSRPVHAAFELSYRSLTPDQQRLFRLLALHPGDEIELGGAAALIGLPAARTRVLLRELRRAHLLEPGVEPDWHQFHDLVRLYAQRCLSDEPLDEREAAIEQVLDHYATTIKAACAHLNPKLTPTEAAGLVQTRADALTWLDRHRRTGVAAVVMAAESHRHEKCAHIASELFRYLFFCRSRADCVTTQELRLMSARRRGNRRDEAETLNNLGDSYLSLAGQTDEAITYYQEALEISRANGRRHQEGRALWGLAHVCQRSGRFPEALTHLTNSLTIDHELGDRHSAGRTLDSLAYTYVSMSRFEDARATTEEALVIFRELGQPFDEGRALSRLGDIDIRTGRLDEAERHLEEALTIRREFGDKHGEAWTLATLAEAHRQRSNVALARQELRDALGLLEQMGIEHEAQLMRNLLSALNDQ